MRNQQNLTHLQFFTKTKILKHVPKLHFRQLLGQRIGWETLSVKIYTMIYEIADVFNMILSKNIYRLTRLLNK